MTMQTRTIEKPTDVNIEREIIRDCLAWFWSCKCCIKLRFSSRPNQYCKHYDECGDFVYSKLKEHFKRVIDRERAE